jgi:small subunit ribosomal protein S14
LNLSELFSDCIIEPGANLATTAKRVKDQKIQEKFDKARGKEPKLKFSTRRHNRCKLCGRPRAYIRKFGLCRLCFRGLALRGEIPGVSKSSW